ncbi:MAG: transporter substrate-binding domain-containing protein, partial [Rhodospirillales bacterium]|nr:transporter substrate-binding domain-containing protein [Rhodospirillales bacterium]
IIGLFPELMAEIEKLSGIKITTSIEPILRAIKSLTSGTKDLIISGVTSPAFRKTISLGVIGCNRTIIVTNNKVAVLRLTEFSGKTIGFVAGGFLYKKFGNKFGIVPVQTSTSVSMFRMLVRYRVDGIFVSDVVFNSYRTEGAPFSSIPADWCQRIGNIAQAEKIFFHLRMPKSSKFQNLIPQLSEAIKFGDANGVFRRIYLKYGSSTSGQCQPFTYPSFGLPSRLYNSRFPALKPQ